MKKLIFFIAVIMLGSVLTAQPEGRPIIKKSIYFGKSKPIREMDVILPGVHPAKQSTVLNFFPERKEIENRKKKILSPKPKLQRYQGSLQSKGPTLNFEGVDNVNGGFPADPNGEPVDVIIVLDFARMWSSVVGWRCDVNLLDQLFATEIDLPP